MRVIAGRLKGRQFDSPHGHRTHPMSEKIRGAIFNALGDIEGLTVFDPFAGSGALCIEAVSRGAAAAVALDIDKHAAETITRNCRQLDISNQVKVVRVNAAGWLETQPDQVFDLVLLDPPYDDVHHELLERLADRAKTGGVVVVSLPPVAKLHLPGSNFRLLNSNSYGDAQLTFYRRTVL